MKKRKLGSILTSGDIRRIHAEIAADTKLREAASERITRNKAALDSHDMAVAERSSPAPKVIKRTRPVHVATSTKTATVAAEVLAPSKPQPTKHERGGGSYSVVMDILRRADGLMAPEVRRKAAEHPEASDSLKNHPSYIYTILDELRNRLAAEKGQDGKWRAAHAAGVH